MTDVNELAVIVTALLAIALGSIWYSPLVFGSYWQRAAGLTEADLVLSKFALLRSLIVAFLSNVVVLLVLAHFIRTMTALGISHTTLALSLIALIGASMASMVVWEKRSLLYFVIHIGYVSLVVSIGIIVISYWPW